MKSSRSRIALLAFLCGTSLLQADILILNNGSKIEGSILSENPTAVRMRYRLTPKIWDEKDFPRTDIKEVIKQSPQEVELIELKKLLPTPDLLPADKYEQLIQDRLRPFVTKYAGTPEAKEAEAMVETLQEEKKRVSNGEVKLEGKWLNPAEAKGEQYNIEAYTLHQEMKAEMENNQWAAALRVFDKLTKSRPSYIASTHYPAAVADALICMDKLETVYSKMALDQPALLKQQAEGVNKLSDDDKRKTKAAIDSERIKYRADSDAQKRAGVRWIDPYKYDSQSISTAQKFLATEGARLRTLNLDDLKARSEAFVTVYRKIGEGDYQGGAAAFQRVQGFASVAEYKDIVADQKNKLLALYGELVRKSGAGQAATSGSSAIGGAGAAGVDDRVARILAEANGQAAPSAPATTAPVGAPGTAPAAPMAAPGTATYPQTAPGVAPAPGTAPAPAAYPPVQQRPVAQAPGTAPAAYPPVQQQPVAPAYVPPVEESNLQTYIMIGMGVLLVLFGAMAFKKKKAE